MKRSEDTTRSKNGGQWNSRRSAGKGQLGRYTARPEADREVPGAVHVAGGDRHSAQNAGEHREGTHKPRYGDDPLLPTMRHGALTVTLLFRSLGEVTGAESRLFPGL